MNNKFKGEHDKKKKKKKMITTALRQHPLFSQLHKHMPNGLENVKVSHKGSVPQNRVIF